MNPGHAEDIPQASSRAKRGAIIFMLLVAGILWIPLSCKLLGSDVFFLRDLGLLSGPRGTWPAWLLAFVIAAVYAGYSIRNIAGLAQTWWRPNPLKLLSIIMSIAAATVEEAFFRRLIMDRVYWAGGGAALQVVASGFTFGAGHLIWGLATWHFMTGVRVALATGSLGLCWGVVYLIGDRSLAPVIVSHFLVSFCIHPGSILAAFRGEMGQPHFGGSGFPCPFSRPCVHCMVPRIAGNPDDRLVL